jgi:hypothetical protein
LWRERAKSWLYTFTQEWPLGGQTHQLSYTVPIQRIQRVRPSPPGSLSCSRLATRPRGTAPARRECR